MELRQHYEERVGSLKAKIKKLKARNRYYIALEIATFAAVIAAIAVYTSTSGYGLICLLAGLAAAVAYVFIRWADGRNSAETDRLEDLLQVHVDELAGLDGDYSRFDDGQQYVNPHHPYSFDLDIFGPESLFQRINRTSTTSGSDALARALDDSRLVDVASRMTLVKGDSAKLLASMDISPDVVFLDPMFPERRRKAATNKKLQLFQRLERPCDNETELLQAAMATYPRKVVVKRPLKGPYLAGVKPSSSLMGKVVRYDIVVPRTS